MSMDLPARAALAVLLLPALAGCKEPRTEIVPGPDGVVTIELVNPTDPACTYCDPFTAVDTLRIDVYAGEELVATGSYAYPSEQARLPDLTGFGVVRIEIAGLSAGKVESGGRTPELALDPGTPMTVPVVFLPVNTALPLAASMVSQRSRHVALRRRDGAVALLGGLDAGRDSAFTSIEVYSPSLSAFAADQAVLPAALGAPATARTDSGDLLLAGGTTASGGVESPVATTGVFLPDQSALAPGGDLPVARAGNCLAPISATQAVTMGGAAVNQVDLGTYDSASGWTWAGVAVTDFDATAVTACAPLPSGSVFVLGTSATNTGLWVLDPKNPGASFNPVNAYTVGDARYVTGAVVAPLSDGTVWVAGGVDAQTGALTTDGRRFTAASLSFSLAASLQEARYDASWSEWYRDGWLVVGCGWQDVDRVRDEPSIELVSPATAENGPEIPLDRSRSGCSVTGLLDGSVLVAGGFGAASGEGADAAIVVPWPDEAPRDTGL